MSLAHTPEAEHLRAVAALLYALLEGHELPQGPCTQFVRQDGRATAWPCRRRLHGEWDVEHWCAACLAHRLRAQVERRS